jgi:hypothetical protein
MTDDLLNQLEATLFITVTWEPSDSAGVDVNFVKLNDFTIRPLNDPHLPRKYPISPLLAGDQVTLSWSMSVEPPKPNKPLRTIAIALASLGTAKPKSIASTSDAANVGPGKTWHDEQDVTLSL